MEYSQVLTIVGTNIALILASLGTTITLFLWARHEAGEDRKIYSEDRKDILNLMRSIEQEMKDFHGRLERQDAEFKAHLMLHHKE
jgi:hypothetical protein